MTTREEHMEHFTILAAQKVPSVMGAVAWTIAVTIALVVCFLIFVPWVQTTAGFGTVMALNPNDRLQEINALVPGRIQEWYVRDGSHVTVGDPIVRIADIDPQLMERLQAERNQVMAKLNAAETAAETAEIDMNRMRDLFDEGLAARREYEQARIRVEELRSRVAEAAAELNRVDVNLSRQSVQIVRAPRSGVILRVFAGDAATFVKAGDIVATFVPDNVDRAVELFIDGRDVALVHSGCTGPAAVRRLSHRPVQRLAVGRGGHVWRRRGGSRPLGADQRAIPGSGHGGSGIPDPWPDQRFVRFGSNARGWVLLNPVSVGYELWRLLNDFPASLPGTPTQAVSQ